MPDSPRLRAITFDFWNTLVVLDVESGRVERKAVLLETLSGLGYEIEPLVVDSAFEIVAERFHDAWMSGQQYVLADGVAAFREAVGVDPVHDVDISESWMRWARAIDLRPVEPDLAKTLSALKRQDLRLGIICDVSLIPSTVLLEHLARLGLRDSFDHWSFSDVVGVYKPAAEIFAHSHAGLEIDDPASVLHIGDLRRTDVAGARSFGSVSARYRGVVDDIEPDPGGVELAEADHVITSHIELLELS